MEKAINTIYLLGGLSLILMVIMAMSSCGSSKQMYNVGTGNPMQRTCGGGWTGGQ